MKTITIAYSTLAMLESQAIGLGFREEDVKRLDDNWVSIVITDESYETLNNMRDAVTISIDSVLVMLCNQIKRN